MQILTHRYAEVCVETDGLVACPSQPNTPLSSEKKSRGLGSEIYLSIYLDGLSFMDRKKDSPP
jgi:hypothetical protein